MSVSCLDEGYYDYPVTLTVDTTELAPGNHSGWVRVDSGGRRACTEVELTVLDIVGAAESSWSVVKSRY
jgi:hypothetical protein